MLNEVRKFELRIKHSNSVIRIRFPTLLYSFVHSVLMNAAVRLWSRLSGRQCNVRICSQDGAAVMCAPVVATGRFCWPRPGAVGGSLARHGWLPSASQRDVAGHWARVETEAVRSCHPLLASLWAYSPWWREGEVRAGTADGVETASFLDHRYAGIVKFCSIPLIPEKDRYMG